MFTCAIAYYIELTTSFSLLLQWTWYTITCIVHCTWYIFCWHC